MKTMKVIKKSVGEKNQKNKYTKWCFKIDDKVIATIEKGSTGVSRGDSKLITHYRASYSFIWNSQVLKEVFGCYLSDCFDIRYTWYKDSPLRKSDWKQIRDYTSFAPETSSDVCNTLNNVLKEKGLDILITS